MKIRLPKDTGGIVVPGIEVSQRIQIITANGPIHVPIISVRKITFGDAKADSVPCIVHDIPAIVDISGLLGLSFLKHFRTVIDYPKLTLHIG